MVVQPKKSRRQAPNWGKIPRNEAKISYRQAPCVVYLFYNDDYVQGNQIGDTIFSTEAGVLGPLQSVLQSLILQSFFGVTLVFVARRYFCRHFCLVQKRCSNCMNPEVGSPGKPRSFLQMTECDQTRFVGKLCPNHCSFQFYTEMRFRNFWHS